MKSSLSLEVGFKKTERIDNSKVNMEQMLPEAGSWIKFYFNMKLMKKGGVTGMIFAKCIHLLSNL